MKEIVLSNGQKIQTDDYPAIIDRYWNIENMLRTQALIDQEYHHNAGLTRKETFDKRKLALWVELGELVNEWKELFKYWSNKKMKREKALEEFVDGIHFLLSIGNDLNIPPYHDRVIMFKNPIQHIFLLSVVIVNIAGVQSFYDAFALYRGLGEHFGFTEEEIEKAYYEKNKRNIEREDHNIGGIFATVEKDS